MASWLFVCKILRVIDLKNAFIKKKKRKEPTKKGWELGNLAQVEEYLPSKCEEALN
jgi:hypothetical protein